VSQSQPPILARFRPITPGTLIRIVPLLALAATASPSLADPARGGSGLGGGFIEFLMTGSVPAYRQGAPMMERPVPDAMPRTMMRRDHSPVHVAHQLEAKPELEQRLDSGRFGYASAPIQSTLDPQFERQEVTYGGPHRAGTVVIDTPNRFLYLVEGNGRAIRYGIGVGRPGFEWAGAKSITRKAEWPDWRPPAQMLKRRPDLPRFMAGGPENPLGARALYLGSSLYRIHGTNEPETIGRAVSSGCIRMRNEDVMDLYQRVKVGTRVVVI
jgi:lipoprotein-anchoring transpeptidase ErfK/SrfK